MTMSAWHGRWPKFVANVVVGLKFIISLSAFLDTRQFWRDIWNICRRCSKSSWSNKNAYIVGLDQSGGYWKVGGGAVAHIAALICKQGVHHEVFEISEFMIKSLGSIRNILPKKDSCLRQQYSWCRTTLMQPPSPKTICFVFVTFTIFSRIFGGHTRLYMLTSLSEGQYTTLQNHDVGTCCVGRIGIWSTWYQNICVQSSKNTAYSRQGSKNSLLTNYMKSTHLWRLVERSSWSIYWLFYFLKFCTYYNVDKSKSSMVTDTCTLKE